jgi:hypothetical protein
MDTNAKKYRENTQVQFGHPVKMLPPPKASVQGAAAPAPTPRAGP